MDCRSLYDLWCEKVTDPELRADLKAMDESGDEAVIEDAFYRTLEFGTAGLRGVLGAGTNRMNIHTVGQATQGIADFIKGQANDGEPGTVAICYDSRINSQLFAHTAASVLAANGIKSYVYPRLQPTPALSFATRYLGCAIGINVTASHNPSKYNGYKVYGPDGCQIASEIADAITQAIEGVDMFDDVRTMPFEDAQAAGLATYIQEEVLDAFLDAVYDQHVEQEQSDLRVVYTPLNGTGLECVTRILERIGVTDIHVVEEQSKPDGNFPTCPYPNPEIREALECGIALCEQVHPDLLLATDPDADRVGIAVKDGNDYQLLSGNEVGVLLLDFICRMRKENGTLPEHPVAVTTIVSTSLVDPVAAKYGVDMRRVLTGFKYIGGVIADPRNLVSFSVMFGMSQNLGGLLGSAILGTFQTWREKYHSSLLADQLTTLNPLVNERIQLYTQMYKSLIGDSALLGTQAITQLQTVTALEANILAYNDTYLLTASIAAATLVWILWRLLRLRITARMALKNATGNK